MISLQAVAKRYPDGHEALRGVSFDVAAGELVMLTGHSGAGKSTLLKLIAGIERPSSGSVRLNGQEINRLRPAATAVVRRSIGLVFQDHKLLFDRTVYENVALPLRINGFNSADCGRRVRAALDKVGLLGREQAVPVTLSGGEQQRLCIARAIVNRPSLVIADEPTGNLDSAYADTIMEMFRSFHQVGVTLVIATHDEAVITKFGARVLRLHQGRLRS
jgi:cell division transport system ATP-binding protein